MKAVFRSIHLQEGGTSLWIGRAVEYCAQSIYDSGMDASAFVEALVRCICDAILTLVDTRCIRSC